MNMLVILIFSVSIVHSYEILVYKFGKNYGQIIFDYSLNNYHGINGANIQDSQYDAKFTDRGLYFSPTACYIDLPPNGISTQSFRLSAPFSIHVWTMVSDVDGRLFYRITTDSYLIIFREIETDSIRLVYSDNIEKTFIFQNTFPANVWIRLCINIEPIKITIFKNLELYTDSVAITSYIEGPTTSSHMAHIIGSEHTNPTQYAIQGFIWFFSMVSEINHLNYISDISSSFCLTGPGTCESCLPSILIDGINGCLSTLNSSTTDSYNQDCGNTDIGCNQGVVLECDSSYCGTISCEINTERLCTCIGLDGTTTNIECQCQVGFKNIDDVCCLDQCNSCDNFYSCASCFANNTKIDATTGQCLCKEGYYPKSLLIGLEQCNACSESCFDCTDASNCTTCKENNAEQINGQCFCFQGYYPKTALTDNNECNICKENCLDCTDFNNCTSCKYNNTELINGQCQCIQGFYFSNISSFCKTCQPDCEICEDLNNCTKCIDINSDAIDGKCHCKSGFGSYEISLSENSCQKCALECSTCSAPDHCLSCISINTYIFNGKCICLDGFGNINSLTNTDSCFNCHEDCKKCRDSLYCIECKYSNTVPNQISGCECIQGYWNSTRIVNDTSCQKCHKDCFNCSDYNTCLSCNSLYAMPALVGCDCIKGYWNQIDLESVNSCQECFDDCETCDNPQTCLTCKDENAVSAPIQGCMCKEKYYNSGTDGRLTCKKCGINCKLCKNNEICQTCSSEYYENVEGKCEEKLFFCDLEKISNIKIFLNFSEPLNQTLALDQIELLITPNQTVTLNLSENTKASYSLQFYFSESNLSYIQVLLALKCPLYSEFFHKLSDCVFNFSFYNEENYSSIFNETLYLTAQIKKVVKYSTTTSVALSIVSNPAAAWSLISTMQFVSYLPLSADKAISRDFQEFCTSMGDFNIMPNPISYMFKPDSSSKPFTEAKKIGIESSVFWVNAGPLATYLLILLIIYPILSILSKFQFLRLNTAIISLKDNYKYNIFLRFWVQVYLDFAVFAAIQLESVTPKQKYQNFPAQYHFNRISAVIIYILILFSPPLLLYFIIAYYSNIKDSNNEEFSKKFGSLFLEFKNNRGVISSFFYVFYLTRRLIYFFAQVYLNEFLPMQKTLNFFGSFVGLAFLIIFRPFKDKSILVSNIVAEFSVFTCFIGIFIMGFIGNGDEKRMVEKFLMFCISGCIVFQSLVPLYSFAIGLKNWWKIVKIKRQGVNNDTNAETRIRGSPIKPYNNFLSSD